MRSGLFCQHLHLTSVGKTVIIEKENPKKEKNICKRSFAKSYTIPRKRNCRKRVPAAPRAIPQGMRSRSTVCLTAVISSTTTAASSRPTRRRISAASLPRRQRNGWLRAEQKSVCLCKRFFLLPFTYTLRPLSFSSEMPRETLRSAQGGGRGGSEAKNLGAVLRSPCTYIK